MDFEDAKEETAAAVAERGSVSRRDLERLLTNPRDHTWTLAWTGWWKRARSYRRVTGIARPPKVRLTGLTTRGAMRS